VPDLQGQLVEGYRPLTVETLPATSDSSFGGAHGTHVAGTIAAKRDGNGVIGLAYNAKIMPIVIFDTSGYVGDDFVADGVIWAVDNGADVLSNSWGGWGYSYVLKDAYDYAIDHGAIVVFSAGNDHTDQHVQAPVGYPGIIGVAAVEYNGGNYRTTFFSNRGDYVSVGAPGVAILSTVPLWDTDEFFDGQHPYAFYQGTSMACPHVSALAALIKEMYPNATQWEVRKILEQSAIDIDDPGYDHNSGYGLINAQSALSLSPADVANMGANLDVVAVDSWGYSLQGVFVALHRKSGNGSNYYAKTDLSGVAHFPGVDTSEYDIIVGGPDSLDGSHYYGGYAGISYVYRQEEERQYTRTINLTANSTETFYFESTFMVDLVSSPTINATVSLNDSIYELMTGLRGSYASLSFTGNNSYDFSPIAGYCYLAITRDSTGATVTINGTATVNGYQIPIFGQLDKDATIAIIDDTGGAYGISLWWSLFGQSF
jgi:subtilisin family serine protease